MTEDSQVEIEETRVRGVTKKIVVHSKITGGSYEIQPKDPSLAPENDHGRGHAHVHLRLLSRARRADRGRAA